MPRGQKKKSVPPAYDPGETPDPVKWSKKLLLLLEKPKSRARMGLAIVIVVIALAIISVIF